MSQTTSTPLTPSAIRLAQALVRNSTKRGKREDPRIERIARAGTPTRGSTNQA